jgi:hypothetical protein
MASGSYRAPRLVWEPIAPGFPLWDVYAAKRITTGLRASAQSTIFSTTAIRVREKLNGTNTPLPLTAAR